MDLRSKTFAVISVTVLGLIVIIYLFSQTILMSSYSSLEEESMNVEIKNAQKEIKFELANLQTLAEGYANSHDTWGYVSNGSPGCGFTQMTGEGFENYRLNIALLVDNNGSIVYGKSYDPVIHAEVPVPADFLGHVRPDDRLISWAGNFSISGVVATSSGVLMVGASPVLPGNRLGQRAGTLLIGRYLNSEEVVYLNRMTGKSMVVAPFGSGSLPNDFAVARDGLAAGSDHVIAAFDAGTINGYSLIRDFYAQPVLIVRTSMSRSLYSQGQSSVVYFLISLVIAGLVFISVTMLLLDRVVTSRIHRLADSVAQIGIDDNLAVRVATEGNDEVSRLARTINRTLDALEQSRVRLFESRRRFQGLVENINDVVWETGEDSRLTYVSPRIQALTGYSPDDMAGRSIRELVVPEDRECMVAFFDAVRQKPDNFSLIEARLQDSDGVPVDVEFSGAPVFDQQGRLAGYRGVARDIRERKLVEKALRKWADIFQHAKIAIVICGADAARFEMANPALARIYGYTVDEMIGMKAKDVVVPECCNSFATGIQKARRDGHHTFESIHVKRDGTQFPAVVDITVARDASGNVLYQIINIQDITERKLVEKQIINSLHEKDVLLKEIHHRVKNNLQIISSLLYLQSETTGREYGSMFKESQDRIRSMALIHEKLYQAKDFSHIDYAEYVRSLTAYLLRSYRMGAGVEIFVNIEGATLGIDTAIPCGLIINELVSNSLKYAFKDRHAGKISISMTREGNRYTLLVGDDGTGLPPGLDFRDTPTLGLQLVNTLVSQLEGTIELLPGTGTAFRITFGK